MSPFSNTAYRAILLLLLFNIYVEVSSFEEALWFRLGAAVAIGVIAGLSNLGDRSIKDD